ncbi:hypothetical protein P3T32_003186 [Ralstonia sp. GP73]|jgi:hypothetical protein|uniref:Uncharacterized protein n=2 Tax=Ralstonia TaxID=48736 RepID=A0AAD2F1G9_9RALS|nr:hypothetical protein [Ralstonia sp. GP73]CAJ0718168.1 hypothetical protein LMG7143_04313 [Ralstonia sp. LMG 18095]CAJ0795902.1 hypothetical protein LMG18095_02816 [Ralstonia sp. LMG 18095]CAJ0798248.1 hypothetical protein R77560_03142 [Ralstonia sp. LMG 18095]CAJ0886150.1 hypothetical protein R6138_03094 [Ralstonia sp. LMG 18095]
MGGMFLGRVRTFEPRAPQFDGEVSLSCKRIQVFERDT